MIYNEIYPQGFDLAHSIKIGNSRITKTLGLLITNTCNATCDLCCKFSSPKDKGRIPIEESEKVIHEAKEYGFTQIGFSGGEVMLHYKELLELGKILNNYEMTFTIATNGYWAKDVEIAKKKLNELKSLGLVVILASFDESHSEFIKAETFRNLLIASKECNVEVELHSAYYKNGKKLKDYFTEDFLKDYKVYESPVIRAGRALTRPIEDFEYPDEKLPVGTCPTPLQPTINYDGKVYPCCSVAGFTKNIEIGNIKNDSLFDIMGNIKNDQFLYYIQKFGFSKLLPKIADDLNFELPAFVSVCDACYFVGKNPKVASRIRKEIDLFLQSYLLEFIDNLIEKNKIECNSH
nr:radical SAM protein [uncultured Allomuricauda sp.]